MKVVSKAKESRSCIGAVFVYPVRQLAKGFAFINCAVMALAWEVLTVLGGISFPVVRHFDLVLGHSSSVGRDVVDALLRGPRARATTLGRNYGARTSIGLLVVLTL